ncbi:unnamed protein product [marine sediment metagenome]|uniref:Uncharacterized protein n=1 Tax=marine sediment metagenome TaxID=412755 RepID=X1V5J8_9ZZZZ
MTMPMCKQCGNEYPKVSQHKLCWDCAMKNMADATKQMKSKSGPIYEKWKKAREEYIIAEADKLKEIREVTEE